MCVYLSLALSLSLSVCMYVCVLYPIPTSPHLKGTSGPGPIRQAAVFTINASWEAWAHATRRAETRSSWARSDHERSSSHIFLG